MEYIDPIAVIREIYPEDNAFRQRLLKHGAQVRDKAFAILEAMGESAPMLNLTLVEDGCFLHDIGSGECRAPEIGCTGMQPYVCHGFVGGKILRKYGRDHGIDMEPYARICERHVSSGLTPDIIRHRTLLLPAFDFRPQTNEEKLICLANKFFSRSADMREKSIMEIRRYMYAHGDDCIQRFDELCGSFGITLDTSVSTMGFDSNWNEFRDKCWTKIMLLVEKEKAFPKTVRINEVLREESSYWTDDSTAGGRWLNDFRVYDRNRGERFLKYLTTEMAVREIVPAPEKQDKYYVIVPFVAVIAGFLGSLALGVPKNWCYLGGLLMALALYQPVCKADMTKRKQHLDQAIRELSDELDRLRLKCRGILKDEENASDG